jgi:hypothetical protein
MAKASSLSGVRKWLQREEWAEPFDQLLEMHLEVPCDAAGIEMAELPDVIGDAVASNVFGCVFEDMLARELPDGSNIVDDYLRRRGWKEPVPNKRYMTALRSSVMSLYEVSEIVPDRSFLARDVLRGGEPVLVSEKRATRGMKPWDLVGLRIVKLGSRTEMTGAALPMRREVGEILRENFVQLREKMREEILGWQKPGDAELEPYALDTEVLRHVAFVFTNIWLDDNLRAVLDPTPAALVNADGDPLGPTTVRYPLNPDADRRALADGLAAIPEFHPTLDDRWDWLGPGGTLAPGNESERADSSGNLLPEGSVSLGHVELEDDTLTLETNSPQRAERARALLDPVIGPFVGEPVVTTVTVDQIMPARPDDEELPSSFGSAEEERAYLQRTLERHYRGLLDRPVSLLGNVSPRESARTTEGREKLVGWLKGLENAHARLEESSVIAVYDTGWLWEELGVSDLRR